MAITAAPCRRADIVNESFIFRCRFQDLDFGYWQETCLLRHRWAAGSTHYYTFSIVAFQMELESSSCAKGSGGLRCYAKRLVAKLDGRVQSAHCDRCRDKYDIGTVLCGISGILRLFIGNMADYDFGIPGKSIRTAKMLITEGPGGGGTLSWQGSSAVLYSRNAPSSRWGCQ